MPTVDFALVARSTPGLEEVDFELGDITSPNITTATLPDGTEGAAYSETLAVDADGGTPSSPAWTIDSGALPVGLALDATSGAITGTPGTATLQTPIAYTIVAGALPDGLTIADGGLLPGGAVISGTPTTPGAYAFTVRATDSTGDYTEQAYSGTVISGPNIIQTALLNIEENEAYSFTPDVENAEAPLVFSVEPGSSLPSGINLNTSTGEFSGTPTVSGDFEFDIRVTDVQGNFEVQPFSASIVPDLLPVIDQSTLGDITLNNPYSTQFTATGGDLPIGWDVSAGSLPTGLTLSPSGLLSGTATSAGPFDFTIRVTDSDGDTDTQQFTGDVAANTTPDIDQTSLGVITQGYAYSLQLTATSGEPPFAWTVAGGTPPLGLTLSTDGLLSGTPTGVGEYGFNVQVIDDNGEEDTQFYGGIVGTRPSINGSDLGTLIVGSRFQQILSASGGTPPLSWAISAGSTPPGMSLLSNGMLSGIPVIAGPYDFTVTVTDNEGETDTQQFTGEVSNYVPAINVFDLADQTHHESPITVLRDPNSDDTHLSGFVFAGDDDIMSPGTRRRLHPNGVGTIYGEDNPSGGGGTTYRGRLFINGVEVL